MMADERDEYRVMDEVFEMGDDDREDLDYDLGDDEQADEVREYQRYIDDPPQNLVFKYHENDDDGRLGIKSELDQEWTRRRHREEERSEDDRPAEVAAIDVVDEPGD
ncbi:hypothetical protein [Nocardia spumae]|uniref:hypothetical protein n=1 Tax=Nocardia spumae TaxID=2887190 RepID=UPI001D141347|nr:hypothetical protein [Nocardia spumae]